MKTTTRVRGRPVWWFILRLVRFRPLLYLASSLFILFFYLFPLIPGYVVRAFFDRLSGAAPAGLNLWSLLALLLGAGLARTAATVIGPVIEVVTQLVIAALLRKNLLARILQHPGARSLPASAGEAISRFRDDIQHIVGFLTWTADPVGQVAVVSVAVVVLARIEPLFTLAVIVPLVITSSPSARSPASSARSLALCRPSRSPTPSAVSSPILRPSTKPAAKPPSPTCCCQSFSAPSPPTPPTLPSACCCWYRPRPSSAVTSP
jgi:ABC-type multidrug transport system fused ATPase/permease subunit